MADPREEAGPKPAGSQQAGAGGAAASETDDAGHASAPGAVDAFKELRDTGRAAWHAGGDSLKALRILFSADVSLARSAFGRTLALTGVAIAFGASCWLLLMAALVTWLARGLGLSFALSLLLCALLSGAITAVAIWRARYYFDHTRMRATRRQLARLGIGELADFMPDAGDPGSARDAAERVNDATDDRKVKKGLGVDITPP